jgi:hypothetical protein
MSLFKKKPGGSLVGNLIRKVEVPVIKAAAKAGESLFGIPAPVSEAVLGAVLITKAPPMVSIAKAVAAAPAPSSTKNTGAGLFNFFTDGFHALAHK